MRIKTPALKQRQDGDMAPPFARGKGGSKPALRVARREEANVAQIREAANKEAISTASFRHRPDQSPVG
jgi:hypothetical protein